ncbi:unnamed protein product [Urochloa humidicola]
MMGVKQVVMNMDMDRGLLMEEKPPLLKISWEPEMEEFLQVQEDWPLHKEHKLLDRRVRFTTCRTIMRFIH